MMMTPLTTSSCPSAPAVSARIAAERKRLGLSQREAAAILRITQSTYKQFESGRHLPSLTTLWGLIDGLEMDPRALLPELFAAAERQAARPLEHLAAMLVW